MKAKFHVLIHVSSLHSYTYLRILSAVEASVILEMTMSQSGCGNSEILCDKSHWIRVVSPKFLHVRCFLILLLGHVLSC